MSPNETVVRDHLETVWILGDGDAAPRFLAEDLLQHKPLLADGRTPLVEHWDVKEPVPAETASGRPIV
jgi:hypothetical protein